MFVELPWGAWTGDTLHQLEFADTCRVDVLTGRDAPSCGTAQIQQAFREPVESPRLRDLARQARNACVVVDDLARPTKAAEILPVLLDELRDGGMPDSSITILIATGTHGGLSDSEIEQKVGRGVAATHPVVVHRGEDTAATGITYGKSELRINRHFLAADLRVGVGSVMPHTFAGYSGGAKLMLPGLADLDATARSHKFVQMGLRGGSDPNQNKFRLEIERLARDLDFRFVTCVVPNRFRETADLHCGDLVAAHRAACRSAAAHYATPIQHTYDCLILNAYPKDGDLIQAENAFVAFKTASMDVVKENGIIVLATAADKLGQHGLFGPEGVSYRPPRPNRRLGERQLWIYAPRLETADIRRRYWEDYPHLDNIDQLSERLQLALPATADVGVLPAAPLQQLIYERSPGKDGA